MRVDGVKPDDQEYLHTKKCSRKQGEMRERTFALHFRKDSGLVSCKGHTYRALSH